jgi:hypothetical protein
MRKVRLAGIAGSVPVTFLGLALVACRGGSSSNNGAQVSTPAITQQPVGPSIKSGQTATLSVAASGTGTLSYQWYQGPSGTTSNPISGASSSSYTTPALTATTSYWVQVTDSNGNTDSNTAVVLIAGPRQVQALMYMSENSSGTVSVKTPGDFLTKVLPHLSGVAVSLQWRAVESSNAAGDGSGGYDFTAFDATLQQFYAAGRTVNLIVWPATEGGNNDLDNGGSTPSYVFSTGYASSLNTTPQDMAVCPSYPGDTSNPFYSQTQSASGGGGSWNITTSSDLSGLPVSYETPFMTAYQNFIVQVIQHYNGNTVTPIGYIRFGFSQGGENSPECNQFWPNYSQQTYLNYIKTMTDFVKAQNPSMTILEDLHALGQLNEESASVYVAYPDAEAADAMADQFGFGTNGLQQSDLTNFAGNQPCDADWCSLFTPAGGFSYSPTLSLQTLQWTDPTGQDSSNPTGSLTQIEPFAKAHGANNLELYPADVGLAFDSANYASYPHAVASLNTGTYSGAYAAAIEDFLTP